MDVPPHWGLACQLLDNLAERVLSGDVKAFNLVLQSGEDEVECATFIKTPQGFDITQLCVATMGQGKALLKHVSAQEGNAPRYNQSELEQ